MYEPPKCRKCHRIISFLPTRSGNKMPVDSFCVYVLPYNRGSVFFKENGEIVRGYKVEKGTRGAIPAYQSHFATCPYADELRGAKKKPDKRRENIRTQVEREREEAARREALRETKAAAAAQRIEAEQAQMSLFPSQSWR